MIYFKKLNPSAKLPVYAHAGDAGLDLVAITATKWEPIFAVHQGEFQIIVGYKAKVNTGLALELPKGYEAQVRSRSGLAAKSNIFVTNAPGTVDEIFRGEIGVLLTCLGQLPKEFNDGIPAGTKIAQLVINKVENYEEIDEKLELSTTKRGEGGFGSTGIT
jgi:dUTP pyrophosphatase